MARKIWQTIASSAALAMLAGCGASKSDVRQTAFTPGTAQSKNVSFDSGAPWACDGADLQAAFSPTLGSDELTSAIKATIADPKKSGASFSFVDPIESFYTEFTTNTLCMELGGSATTEELDGLVNQLRKSGNVVSVRTR